jgi:hypothetical protein
MLLTGMSVEILVHMLSVRWSWSLPHCIAGRQSLKGVLDAGSCIAFGSHPLIGNFFEVQRRRIDLRVMALLGDVCGVGIRAWTQSHDDTVGSHIEK